MIYYGSNQTVARFVKDLLMDGRLNSALITITTLAKSEVCSVHIAIDTSLEDIVSEKAKIFSVALLNTSPRNTQDG